jgi:hypothetical protein
MFVRAFQCYSALCSYRPCNIWRNPLDEDRPVGRYTEIKIDNFRKCNTLIQKLLPIFEKKKNIPVPKHFCLWWIVKEIRNSRRIWAFMATERLHINFHGRPLPQKAFMLFRILYQPHSSEYTELEWMDRRRNCWLVKQEEIYIKNKLNITWPLGVYKFVGIKQS